MKIAIIGAGVAGLGIGWQLAKRDHDVTIFERDTPGYGASTAAAGMLAPTAEVTFEEESLLDLNQRSRAMYPDFVKELEADAGVTVDYRDEGTLVVGLDRDDTEALDRLLEYQRALGLTVERLNGEEARAIAPALSPRVHSAVYCREDHQVDPPKLVDALVRAFKARGGTLRDHTAIEEVVITDGVARGCRDAEGTLHSADHIVVATGAWTRELGGFAKGELPHVRPVRGQMISVLQDVERPLLEHVIRAPDAYLVPKSDGRIIIGATMEEMGFDDRLTAGGVFELLRGAWEAMPGIYDLPIERMWTGFRPITLSNEPVLGPSSTVDGVWFATGHGRNGILLTPITAKQMATTIHTFCS